MLVLTRKTGQSIMIGEIEVTVAEIRGDQVRVGINAPKDVIVHRKEVYEQVQRENEAASRTPADVPGSTVGLTLEEIRQRGKMPYSPD